MKITNKDVIQSYIVTTARYDFTVYEKRILYRLVEFLQPSLEGEKLKGKIAIKQDLFGHHVTMAISCFLKDEEDHHHDRVKEAFRALENKKFEYEDDKTWEIIRIVQAPVFNKNESHVKFWLQPKIYDALLNFSKGYRKLELETAMSFESVYAMRFYELLSGQKSPLTYTIDHLKLMFQLQDKYPLTADFIRRVVEPAKKELDKKSPYSFKYKANKEGKKIHTLTFYPIYQVENRDPVLEKKQLQKKVSLSWDLDRMVVNYLKENFGFTEAEIKNNIDILKMAAKEIDLMYELSLLKEKANKARSPQGYVVGVLKKKLKPIQI